MGHTPPELIHDDPEWPLPGLGGGPSSPRRLRVWQRPAGELLAVITERGPGVSVTNVAEHVHAALSAAYAGRPLRVLEHYPPEPGELESFDEITVVAGQPHWRRLSTPDLIAAVGAAVLDDMPPLPPDPERPATSRPRPPAPTGPGPADDVVFRGYCTDAGALVVLEAPGGDQLGLLPHYVKHSLDGFAWGYLGSGPAELARCLLIAVLGSAAACEVCTGSRTEVECPGCEDGITVSPRQYQAFKQDVVARWPQHAGWQLAAGQLRRWLAARPGSPEREGSS